MQPDGGLVQDVQSLPGGALGKLTRELDPLGLAARESRRGLADADIAQADILKGLQAAHHRLEVGEDFGGGIDGQVEYIGDGIALVAHLQSFPVVALAMADIAGHVHVGEELHLDLDLTVPAARLAASAAHIERETPLLIAADFALRQLGEQVADVVKHAGIGARVGARRAANRRLVDVDDLVDLLDALDAIVRSGLLARAVQLAPQRFVKRFAHQGGFS